MAPAESLRVVLAAVAGLGDGVHVRLAGIHRRIHVGELALHELEGADRLAELLTLMDVGHDDVHGRLHDAERSGRQDGALVVEAAHQHIDALAEGTQHVLLGNLAILENQLAGRRAAHAHLVELLRHLEALAVGLDDEGRDAARAGGGIGLGVDDDHLGVGAVGDPHLRAIQHVAVALLVGTQLHRNDVRARTRLAHREAADVLAGDQLGQEALLLVRRCRCGESG